MVTDANQRSESVPEAQDTAPELDAAGISDPLCNLATNKDSKGVQGKWRLILAIILCTLFMVQSSRPTICIVGTRARQRADQRLHTVKWNILLSR